MNLEELRAVQDRERETDSLQHLRDSFYGEVGTYVSDLRAERERRADDAEDPFADPEVRRLTDEIETAEEVAESIYERRMGKLVKTASLAAAGYAAETEGLTTEEAELFEDLVARIESNQAAVLEVLSAGDPSEFEATARDATARDATAREPRSGGTDGDESPVPPADGGPEGPVDAPEVADSGGGDPVADAPADGPVPGDGSDGEPDDPPVPSEADPEADRPAAEAAAATAESDDSGGFDASAVMGDDDRVTLRITEDVGEIVGVDGTAYDLTVDDVVTLPEENALPLVEKDAATRVD